MIFGTINDKDQNLRAERAQILVALRDLLYKDMELMEDHECDYCNADDGHNDFCTFADAFEIVLQERAQTLDGILIETTELRDALVMLLAEDTQIMGSSMLECTHCGGISHTEDCVIRKALDTLKRIPRRSL